MSTSVSAGDALYTNTDPPLLKEAVRKRNEALNDCKDLYALAGELGKRVVTVNLVRRHNVTS